MEKISRGKKIAMAVFIFIFTLSASWLYLICTLPLPDYVPYKVRLPQGVWVLSHDNVVPGTFKVQIQLNEIEKRAGQATTPIMAVYDEGTRDTTPFQINPKIIYWLPIGNGVFGFAIDYVPRPSLWHYLFFGWGTTFKKDTGEFVYSFSRYSGSSVLAAIFIVLSLLIIGTMFYDASVQQKKESCGGGGLAL